MVQRTTIIY